MSAFKLKTSLPEMMVGEQYMLTFKHGDRTFATAAVVQVTQLYDPPRSLDADPNCPAIAERSRTELVIDRQLPPLPFPQQWWLIRIERYNSHLGFYVTP